MCNCALLSVPLLWASRELRPQSLRLLRFLAKPSIGFHSGVVWLVPLMCQMKSSHLSLPVGVIVDVNGPTAMAMAAGMLYWMGFSTKYRAGDVYMAGTQFRKPQHK